MVIYLDTTIILSAATGKKGIHILNIIAKQLQTIDKSFHMFLENGNC